ncbi:MAG: twin-arginine translocase subunit TatC [Flavobacteriales bacterium]|nr:twin-arginine translocase subunit TatC [Bacteroidota bacterium]MCB9241716.1 twin-arginine translocase subunit TatC [Flavobacteriales bacterium]
MPLDQHDVEAEEKNMTFLEHIEELRWHIIRSLIAVIVASIVAMVNYRFVFDEIIFGITKESFPLYRWFCTLSDWIYGDNRICLDVVQIDTQNLDVSGQFLYLMIIGFTAGVILAAPFILYEFWRFFRPALKPAERKYTTGIVLVTSMLFFIGVLFGYMILSPLCINFFTHFSLTDHITNNFTLQSYISFVSTLTLSSGIVFELPLLIYILAKLGLVTAEFLKKYRRHAVVIILIVASIITPPDVMSQILLTIPIYFLYEIGIFIALRIQRQQAKKQKI